MAKPKNLSKAQQRQHDAKLREKGKEALTDLTCHPNPRIAAWAIDNPEKAKAAIERGALEDLA